MFETVGRSQDREATWRTAVAGCGTVLVALFGFGGITGVLAARWLWRLFWLFLAALLQRPDLELVELELEDPDVVEEPKIALDFSAPVEVEEPAPQAPEWSPPEPKMAALNAGLLRLLASDSGSFALLGSLESSGSSADVLGSSYAEGGFGGLIGTSDVAVGRGGLGLSGSGLGGGGTGEGIGSLGGLGTIGHGGGGGTASLGYGSGRLGSARVVELAAPRWPAEAGDLEPARCRATVTLTDGRVDSVAISGCPAEFVEEARRVVRDSRWEGTGTARTSISFDR